VQDLCAWLAARRCVATAIEWRWRSEKRQNARYADEPIDTHLLLRASEAHADPAVWWRLTQTHWQQQVLGQPAVAVYLRAVETYAQTDHTPSLWRPARGQSAESVGACLDRLQARLGVDAVRMVALHDAVAPEAQQQWRAYDPSASRRRVSAHIRHTPIDTTVDPREATYQAQMARTHDVQLLRPPWLLQTPQRLLVREERPVVGVPLRLLMGPERMELVGWSEAERPAPVIRDYYVAWSASAGLLWVYKTQTSSLDTGTTEVRWYLHGLYG
jgi:protein ImuB